jgi:hypothetical protein
MMTVQRRNFRGFYIVRAFILIVNKRVYLMILICSSFLVSLFYMFLLPSLPTGSFSIYAIRFITPLQIAFATIFGVLMSLVLLLNFFALKVRAKGQVKFTAGSLLASLVNGLCCTPLISSFVALTGVSTPVLLRFVPPIEAFFEFNYAYFYLLSAALLLFSLHYLSRNIVVCCKRNKGIIYGHVRRVP